MERWSCQPQSTLNLRSAEPLPDPPTPSTTTNTFSRLSAIPTLGRKSQLERREVVVTQSKHPPPLVLQPLPATRGSAPLGRTLRQRSPQRGGGSLRRLIRQLLPLPRPVGGAVGGWRRRGVQSRGHSSRYVPLMEVVRGGCQRGSRSAGDRAAARLSKWRRAPVFCRRR